MTEFFQSLNNSHRDLLILAGIGAAFALLLLAWKIVETIRDVARSAQREQTRREIAAYVAEGSMTPETAERLLGKTNEVNWEKHIADLLESGQIDSDEAAKLLKVASTAARQPKPAAVNLAAASPADAGAAPTGAR